MSHSIELKTSRAQSYPIYVGIDLWDQLLDFCLARYASHKAFVAVDSKVYGFHGDVIEAELNRYFKSVDILQVPEGEGSKSVGQWKNLQNTLLSNGVERLTPLFAVGGGVTGDLAGFVAATVLRGIPLVHIPTSLLAMVDSSIGGKTGINHPSGKNLIGAFYQPDAVFADGNFLRTLERREWIGGLAEMLKYAAIQSPDMFDELENAVNQEFVPDRNWLQLIFKSAAAKAQIVQQDELEAGKRAWLNFGHTFGHALEKCVGYGNVSHGEAVYSGMLAAVHYSQALGAPIDKARFSPFNSLYRVRLSEDVTIPDLIDAMHYDKKVKNETIRLVLLNDWGQPYIKSGADEKLLEESWQAAFNILTT